MDMRMHVQQRHYNAYTDGTTDISLGRFMIISAGVRLFGKFGTCHIA